MHADQGVQDGVDLRLGQAARRPAARLPFPGRARRGHRRRVAARRRSGEHLLERAVAVLVVQPDRVDAGAILLHGEQVQEHARARRLGRAVDAQVRQDARRAQVHLVPAGQLDEVAAGTLGPVAHLQREDLLAVLAERAHGHGGVGRQPVVGQDLAPVRAELAGQARHRLQQRVDALAIGARVPQRRHAPAVGARLEHHGLGLGAAAEHDARQVVGLQFGRHEHRRRLARRGAAVAERLRDADRDQGDDDRRQDCQGLPAHHAGRLLTARRRRAAGCPGSGPPPCAACRCGRCRTRRWPRARPAP